MTASLGADGVNRYMPSRTEASVTQSHVIHVRTHAQAGYLLEFRIRIRWRHEVTWRDMTCVSCLYFDDLINGNYGASGSHVDCWPQTWNGSHPCKKL